MRYKRSKWASRLEFSKKWEFGHPVNRTYKYRSTGPSKSLKKKGVGSNGKMGFLSHLMPFWLTKLKCFCVITLRGRRRSGKERERRKKREKEEREGEEKEKFWCLPFGLPRRTTKKIECSSSI